jgi:hypothetical protein
MGYTTRLTEQLAVVGLIPARHITTAATTIYSNVVDMHDRYRALVIASGSSYGTTKNVKGITVKLWDCDASGTAASTCFQTSAVTHIPGTAASNPPVILAEITGNDLGVYGAGLNVRGRYFKASITNSTAVLNHYAAFILADSRYGPANTDDHASVTSIEVGQDIS